MANLGDEMNKDRRRTPIKRARVLTAPRLIDQIWREMLAMGYTSADDRGCLWKVSIPRWLVVELWAGALGDADFEIDDTLPRDGFRIHPPPIKT